MSNKPLISKYSNKPMKQDVGAIWVRTSKNGDRYCSISVTIDGKKINLVGFKNKFKDPQNEMDEAKPDYRLFESDQPVQKEDTSL